MKRDESFTEFVLEQLSGLGPVRSKSMFGGHGFYRGETLFGMEYKGKVYFRVSDTTRPRYEARGMDAFKPGPSMTMRKYYEVPLDVLEDAGELVRWAREAEKAAADGKGAAKKKPTRPGAAASATGPGRKRVATKPAARRAVK